MKRLDFYIGLAVFTITAGIFLYGEYYNSDHKKDYSHNGQVVELIISDFEGIINYTQKPFINVRYLNNQNTWKEITVRNSEIRLLDKTNYNPPHNIHSKNHETEILF